MSASRLADVRSFFAAATHEDRRMMALKWPGESFEIGHSIMLARKGDSVLCEELFDDVQRLYQAIDAYFP